MNTRSYSFFLLDEAAQAAEHESCCGLARVNNLGCVCLAGDHQQLPPFSRNEKVKEYTQLSMMERLHSSGLTCVLLDTQYRMHEAIAAWPSQYFYKSKLQTAPHLCNIDVLPEGILWPAAKIPMVFVHSGRSLWCC